MPMALSISSAWPRLAAAAAVVAILACGAAADPPANDECANAILIGCNSTVVADNSGATVSPGDSWTCRIGGGVGAGSIWYRFQATHTSARVQTCASTGAANDSILQVFSGTCGNFISIGCNDDGCNNWLSIVDVTNLIVGQTYYIQMSSWTAASLGAYTLELTCPRPTVIPNCSNPVATVTTADLPFSYEGTFIGATPDPNPPIAPPCALPASLPSRWIRFTSTSSGILEVQTDYRQEVPQLSVLWGDMCSQAVCLTFGDGGRVRAEIEGSPESPQTYHVVARRYPGGGNDFSMNMRVLSYSDGCDYTFTDAVPEDEPVCPSSPDMYNGGCNGGGFVHISLGTTYSGTTSWPHQTNITDEDWYTLTLPDTTTIRVSARASIPLEVGLMEPWTPNPTGSCSELTYNINPVFCTSPDNGCPFESFETTLGPGTWMFRVQPHRAHAWSIPCGSPQGQYLFRVGLATSDPNCINPLASLNTDQFPTVLPFNMGDHPTVNFTAPACGPSVAFDWHAAVRVIDNARGVVYARVDAPGVNPQLTVYRGDSCDNLVCVAQGRSGEVRFDSQGSPEAPQTYYLFCTSDAPFLGELALEWEELCDLLTPPLAQPENEPDCGLPVDTTNGGCSASPPVFGTIEPGVPVTGTIAYNLAGVFDRDYFQFTLAEAASVEVSAHAAFPGQVGLMQTSTSSPTGACSEMEGTFSYLALVPASAGGVCEPGGFTASLGAGTWTVVVKPDPSRTWTIPCGSPQGQYVLRVNAGGGADCNQNGIPDHLEIAGNPALDCFNPGASTVPPFAAGGADGILDACQCVANWNRDSALNSSDISAYITSWLHAVGQGNNGADVNCDDLTNSTDISAFITIWIDRISTPTPWFGCPE